MATNVGSNELKLTGLPNPFALAGLDFLGSFFSGLGGPSASSKRNRQLYDRFTNELSAPPPQFLNVNKAFQDLQFGLRPELSKQAQGLSSRLGISSPLAQAGLAQLTASSFANIRAQLEQQLAGLQLQNLFSLRSGALQAAAGS